MKNPDVPCGPLMKVGMWVFDGGDQIGKVTRVFTLAKDDYMSVELYDRDGCMLGIEKRLEQYEWQRIKKPEFPLSFRYLNEILEIIE